MKYIVLTVLLCYYSVSYSQQLELINIDNVNNIPLGQGVEFRLRIKLDKIEIDTSSYEFLSDIKLENKFIVIPKKIGINKIGPFTSGKLISNSIELNVVPLLINSPVFISSPDSVLINQKVKIVLTNTAKNNDYSIKNFKMKSTSQYNVVEQSYSMSISESDKELTKKETLLITIIPLELGDITITKKSFEIGNIKEIEMKEKTVNVFTQ